MRKEIYRQLNGVLTNVPRIETAVAETGLGSFDIRVLRLQNGFRVEASPDIVHTHPRRAVRGYSATWIYWLHMADRNVKEIICDASDGDWTGTADFVFSGFSQGKTLMPDGFFFREKGYDKFARFAKENPVAWSERSNPIVWRGAMNGRGIATLDPGMQTHPGVIQRLRMANKCRAVGPELDFKFTSGGRIGFTTMLQAEGLMADRIPETSWSQRKFAFDIDGYANAWDNLLKRLHLGCCVLKVGSNFGFRQWYYDDLEPYRHFVPIKADMSDLEEQIEWVRSHDKDCREIATEGQDFARRLTWESECHRAGRLIDEKVLSQ